MKKSPIQKLIFHPLFQCFVILLATVVILSLLSFSGIKPIAEVSVPDQRASFTPTPKIEQRRKREELKFKLNTYKPEKSEAGINVIPIRDAETVYLTDMEGNILHQWNFYATRARLLPNCNLLVVHGSRWGPSEEWWRERRRGVYEYTWDGEIAWQYKARGVVHHDASRLPNGNTTFLKRVNVVSRISVAGKRENPPWNIRSDSVVEVNPAGEIVWEWFAHKHLDLNSCGWRGCSNKYEEKLIRKRMIDWTHTNTASVIPENQWHKKGDKRFTPGNVIILPRNLWTIYIVDKKSGKIVWDYEGDHNNGKNIPGGLVRGHEAYMIPQGYPGEGNILVFDNGDKDARPYSIIREIHPPTKKLVWSYHAPGFFSHASSVMQRLKNGNTLISQDNGTARVFEVTPEGEIVWDLRPNKSKPERATRFPHNYCPKFAQLQTTANQKQS